MHVLSKEGLLKTKDGKILFQQSWNGDACPKGSVILLHGFGEHSGRYQWFAKQLVLGGYAVHTFDQRCHGKSEGLRAFIRDYDLLLDDLETCISQMEISPERIYLFGQGTGAGIALNFSAERESRLGGLILSGPICNHPRPDTFSIRFFSRFAAFAFPRMSTLDYLYRWNPQGLSRRQYAVE
jgi:alpha-beta hydrolase superfamily lysophospholipase